MKKKIGLISLAVLLVGSLVVACAPKPAAPPPPAKITWRWGTADPLSYGYKVSAFMADYLRRGMPDYDVTVYPFVSTTANVKEFCIGKLESVYIAEPGFRELYSFTGPFKDFEREVKKMPVQSFWCYTMETHMLTLPEHKDKYRTWEDLHGKKVFMTPAGYMNYINIMRAFKICGVDITHVEVDTAKVADALKAGTIEATASYTTALVSLPSWAKTLDIATPLQGINPSPKQIEMLTKAGFTPVAIDIKKAYTRPLGVTELYGVPFYFGYHHGIDFPEDGVYRALKVFEAAAAELAKLEPGFGPMAKDFAKFQVLGIRSIPEVPVHPGLAKYLKEKGLWDPTWVIATKETIDAAIKKMKG